MDFWPQSVYFRRGPPTIFRKHIPSGMGTESLGVIGCIFAENGPLECRIESSFSGTGWGAKGDFRWIFGPISRSILPRGPPPNLSEAHTSGYGLQKVWGARPSNIRREWAKKYLKSPLAPQPVPLKLDSMRHSKGPFSANIHPITPKLSVPIPEGMCFRKMVGGPLRNTRIGAKNPSEITLSTPAGTTET